MSASTCRSCKAPVEWVEYVKDGRAKRMPLDVEPSERGNVVVVSRSHLVVFKDAAAARAAHPTADLRLSHFVTCPDRRDWRS